jgi:uncharacterized protein
MKRKPSKDACAECGAACCRYVALEIDRPACKRDYDNIRWYLLHRNVQVFVDHERRWHVEFTTDCSALDDTNACRFYGKRPLICREHGDRDDAHCEFLGGEAPHLLHFATVEAFERYLDRRGVDWRWQRGPGKNRP